MYLLFFKNYNHLFINFAGFLFCFVNFNFLQNCPLYCWNFCLIGRFYKIITRYYFVAKMNFLNSYIVGLDFYLIMENILTLFFSVNLKIIERKKKFYFLKNKIKIFI